MRCINVSLTYLLINYWESAGKCEAKKEDKACNGQMLS